MCEKHATDTVIEPSGARGTGPTRLCRPADARRAVERLVAERCRVTHTHWDPDALGDALLVASELATNAMLHGGGVTDFRVDVAGPCLCVSVSDRSAELPVARPPVDARGRRRSGGLGWPIVCRLARDVRVSELPAGGKCITALVALP
ncbi:ATP-binding protein [Streptomyces griseorubiginosus]|uniref:ATP-binding protein n=1 Tax=Streptomyces griseorubiginosus TaxID=67304 RepID=UPI001AD738AA|nr:ATP-binding protein [Streptomyces griseorubiginosus]MBO4252778.1 ATP-binding protein [Streptomyces griseorubiginosus]